ncbi:MAG: NAD(P)/FAD-dependent oxidoreductase [Defluviitaleaceae bacterium]|nr:NAD(P)/FAD-dependent oxidoreductase [Defluviitaleaceae bacterium]
MYDVIIIGAGIVGCAVARVLSRYALDILVIEKGADVAVGATKANSGILHAGYDCVPGTLKAKMNVRGLQLYQTLVQELAIPHKMNGALVVSTVDGTTDTDAGIAKLRQLYDQGIANGVRGMELLSAAQARALEPNLHASVNGALRAASAGIISPYEAAIAFAENAAASGTRFLLEASVTAVRKAKHLHDRLDRVAPDASQSAMGGASADGSVFDWGAGTTPCFVVTAERHGIAGEYRARVVINAAGINSGVMANYERGLSHRVADAAAGKCEAASAPSVKIQPQRGQYYLLDNTQRDLITHTIFQLPTQLGKGVLIAPTVDGNVLLGPTAEAIEDRQRTNDPAATATTSDGLAEALDKARQTLAHIPIGDRITAFAGVRAKHSGGDFILEEMPDGFIHAIGIDSPGLTAAPAIAERLAEMALARLAEMPHDDKKKYREPTLKPDFIAQREAILRLRDLPESQPVANCHQLKPANPAYGAVVCRCETVTQAEITEAMRRFALLQGSGQVAILPVPQDASAHDPTLPPAIPANLDAIKRRTRAQMGRCQGGFCTVRLMELIAREYGLPEAAVTKNGHGTAISATHNE